MFDIVNIDTFFITCRVSNQIVIKAHATEIPQILNRKEVLQAYTNKPIGLTIPDEQEKSIEAPAAIEWNVTKVNAPDAWALGYRGQNIILAGQDTGYQWDHPALIDRYRGWDGQNADHNYNWHDAIDNPNVVCGSEPCDDHSHGSHTMGTMLGDDGGSNQLGVAPDAQWMGCRNMNQGDGTPDTYLECFQWFLEPTDLNDQNPDVGYAPHIINLLVMVVQAVTALPTHPLFMTKALPLVQPRQLTVFPVSAAVAQ